MRTVSSIQRTAILVAGLASSLALVAPAASAAAVHPNTNCTAETTVDVLDDYGNVFDQGSQEYTDYNGTSGSAQASFSNTWSGTQTASISAQFSVKLGFILEEANLQLTTTYTASQTITTGHGVIYTIPAHEYGHAEYGTFRRHLYMDQYDVTGGCKYINYIYGDVYLDNGAGWKFWTATS